MRSGIKPHEFVGKKEFVEDKRGRKTKPTRCESKDCGHAWWHRIHNKGKSSKKKAHPKKSIAQKPNKAIEDKQELKRRKRSDVKNPLNRMNHRQREEVLDTITDLPPVKTREVPVTVPMINGDKISLACPHCDGQGRKSIRVKDLASFLFTTPTIKKK
jgi:hypothetical protein